MARGNLPVAPNRQVALNRQVAPDRQVAADAQAATRNPHNLPTKICAHCGRPFTWRKKWARDWDSVKHCSDKCRAAARKSRA